MKKTKDLIIAELQAYYMTNLACVLAKKGGGYPKDEVPMLKDVAVCYDEYVVDFDSKFVYTPQDEEGNALWIAGENRTGLVGQSYQYWLDAATIALHCETENSKKEFGRIAGYAVKEMEFDEPYFVPGEPPTNAVKDYAHFGAFAGSRAAYWMSRGRTILRNADALKFRPTYRCSVSDLMDTFDIKVMLKDSDKDVNDGSAIDHSDMADVGTMSLDELRQRYADQFYLQPVEFEKFMKFQPAFTAWYKWTVALDAMDHLKHELQRSIERAQSWVESNSKSKPNIASRKKHHAA